MGKVEVIRLNVEGKQDKNTQKETKKKKGEKKEKERKGKEKKKKKPRKASGSLCQHGSSISLEMPASTGRPLQRACPAQQRARSRAAR